LPVLHLVVFDWSNPHAVAFQVSELSLMLERIAEELGPELPHVVSGEALRPLATALRGAPLDGFEQESGEQLEKACTALAALLAVAERTALGLSDELQRRFFTHAGTPAPMGIAAP
jgi:uncharacterized alpha-E superfamily protein